MGREKRTIWGAPKATNIRLLYAKGIKLVPPSNNEFIHLYTKNLIFNLSLKMGKQAIVTKRDVTQ